MVKERTPSWSVKSLLTSETWTNSDELKKATEVSERLKTNMNIVKGPRQVVFEILSAQAKTWMRNHPSMVQRFADLLVQLGGLGDSDTLTSADILERYLLKEYPLNDPRRLRDIDYILIMKWCMWEELRRLLLQAADCKVGDITAFEDAPFAPGYIPTNPFTGDPVLMIPEDVNVMRYSMSVDAKRMLIDTTTETNDKKKKKQQKSDEKKDTQKKKTKKQSTIDDVIGEGPTIVTRSLFWTRRYAAETNVLSAAMSGRRKRKLKPKVPPLKIIRAPSSDVRDPITGKSSSNSRKRKTPEPPSIDADDGREDGNASSGMDEFVKKNKPDQGQAFLYEMMYHLLQIQDQFWFLPQRVLSILGIGANVMPFNIHSDRAQRVVVGSNLKDLINQESIPYMDVIGAEFFGIGGEHKKKAPVLRLHTKSSPQKTQGRLWEQHYISAAQFDNRQQEYQIWLFMCALMGNYSTTVIGHHPTTALRYTLYTMWHSCNKTPHTWTWITESMPLLLKHAIHLYTFYRLRNDPVYDKHRRKLHNFKSDPDVFEIEVNDVVRVTRRFLDHSRRVLICADILKHDRVTERLTKVTSEINRLISGTSKGIMVRANYCKRQHNFLHALSACVDKVPTRSLPPPPQPPSSSDSVITTWEDWGIREEVFDLLRELIEDHCDPYYPFPEWIMLNILDEFGCPPQAIQRVEEMVYEFRADKKLKFGCLFLRDHFPHTYAVIQAFASIWKRFTLLRSYKVNLRMLELQVSALQCKQHHRHHHHHHLSCKRTKAESLDGKRLAFCKVCLRNRTYIRNSGPSIKLGINVGFQNIRLKLDPGAAWVNDGDDIEGKGIQKIRAICDDKQTFGNDACWHDDSLISVVLVGQMIEFRGHMITVCGFPGCGTPTVINPLRCAYFSGVWLCEECTIVLLKVGELVSSKLPPGARSKWIIEMPFMDIVRQYGKEPMMHRLLGQSEADPTIFQDVDDPTSVAKKEKEKKSKKSNVTIIDDYGSDQDKEEASSDDDNNDGQIVEEEGGNSSSDSDRENAGDDNDKDAKEDGYGSDGERIRSERIQKDFAQREAKLKKELAKLRAQRRTGLAAIARQAGKLRRGTERDRGKPKRRPRAAPSVRS